MQKVLCLTLLAAALHTAAAAAVPASAGAPTRSDGCFALYAALLYRLTGQPVYGDEAKVVILRWARAPNPTARRGPLDLAAAYAATSERFSDRERLDVEIWLRCAHRPAAIIAAGPVFVAAIGDAALAALTLEDFRGSVDRAISRASARRGP